MNKHIHAQILDTDYTQRRTHSRPHDISYFLHDTVAWEEVGNANKYLDGSCGIKHYANEQKGSVYSASASISQVLWSE